MVKMIGLIGILLMSIVGSLYLFKNEFQDKEEESHQSEKCRKEMTQLISSNNKSLVFSLVDNEYLEEAHCNNNFLTKKISSFVTTKVLNFIFVDYLGNKHRLFERNREVYSFSLADEDMDSAFSKWNVYLIESESSNRDGINNDSKLIYTSNMDGTELTLISDNVLGFHKVSNDKLLVKKINDEYLLYDFNQKSITDISLSTLSSQ